jgi:hypothetical protein
MIENSYDHRLVGVSFCETLLLATIYLYSIIKLRTSVSICSSTTIVRYFCLFDEDLVGCLWKILIRTKLISKSLRILLAHKYQDDLRASEKKCDIIYNIIEKRFVNSYLVRSPLPPER